MTLRLRLVAAIVVLVMAGLGLFGFATYSLYARSQYDRLDDQVRSSVPFVSGRLVSATVGTVTGFDDHGGQPGGGQPAGGQPGGHEPGGHGHGDGDGGPPPNAPVATYAELRDSAGKIVTSLQLETTSATPSLPTSLTAPASGARFFTASAATGSGQWRVYVSRQDGTANSIVVAVPMNDVAAGLHRLVLIEMAGGAALLAILCAGAWVILRRGLRPLEQMAGTAGQIAAGDLAQRVSPAGDASEVGRLGLALNTMLDEIQSAFAERDATEHRLRQFLSDASHELRTPLTSIQGFAELFRIGDQSQVDLPTILRRIEQESARMRVLVEDLLLLARLDETRPVEEAPVDLAVLTADACTDAVAAAPSRSVTLDAPAPVMVLGDQPLLRQAIANLVANAVTHTADGTAIDVSAWAVDGDAVVTVRDHGAGLSDDALGHVFDRFWQGDSARVGQGTGLGLSIVAGVAAEHGGRASAANAPDGGAVFTLRLPLA